MKSRLTGFIITLILLPAVIFARDIIVYVEDGDLGMPLEGAAVIIRGGTQVICDEDGIARLVLPDGRPAIITVTYPGYEPLRMTIPSADGSSAERFTATLLLGGIMTSAELVIEAVRPETSETRSGRSVAISERELTQTAEIGIIEDVMNSVKLLPGVGYTGMFSAMPSIRGGDPGDLVAVFDGFYLERPYHWLGSISIFDPKMVSTARLSHGVFSARYGHTISGLLEVTSRSPSHTETEIEVGIGSSAANLNLSLPFDGKGGILIMGKVSYWDTLIWGAQQLSTVVDNEHLDLVNSITTAPYIRSAGVSMNYRITPDTDWRLNAFFGSDGIGADFITDYSLFTNDDIDGTMEIKADYTNLQGFLITGITTSPDPKFALRITGGVGFISTATDSSINNNITAAYNQDFLDSYGGYFPHINAGDTYSAPNINAGVELDNSIFNAQLRVDADIDLGHGFIAAFGVQELYSMWDLKQNIGLDFLEMSIAGILEGKSPEEIAYLQAMFPIFNIPGAALISPITYGSDIQNQGFTTSAYALLEYTSPSRLIGAELGLRVDHLYFLGSEITFQTVPALNPRFNIDFNILRNLDNIDLFSITLGTGLFSSVNQLISFMESSMEIGDEVKFNRSWTSVIGFKLDFMQNYSFNIEGYYKYVFDRAYISADLSGDAIVAAFHFDGIGHVWGFDFQLQKLESRYWDGWISYTFNWAEYYDPSGGGQGISMGNVDTDSDWYFPSFHRFHNLNLVLNIKPVQWFNIGIRFGFASGQPRDKVSDELETYPVQLIDENGFPQTDEHGNPLIIQKYRRVQLDNPGMERSSWSLPLDIKFSFFPVNRNGRSSMEIYLAGENLLSLVYTPTSGNTTFNEFTGKEDQGNAAGNFDIPIPLVSFGIKWRY